MSPIDPTRDGGILVGSGDNGLSPTSGDHVLVANNIVTNSVYGITEEGQKVLVAAKGLGEVGSCPRLPRANRCRRRSSNGMNIPAASKLPRWSRSAPG